MWCSVLVICVVLGVVVCSHHRLEVLLGSPDWHRQKYEIRLGQEKSGKIEKTEAMLLANKVIGKFNVLIDARKDADYDNTRMSFRKQVNGSLYFVKVPGAGSDGSVVAMLRIQGKQERLQGYVIVTDEDYISIEFIKDGTNMNKPTYPDIFTGWPRESTELPMTKYVRDICIKLLPMFRERIVDDLQFLIDRDANLQFVAFKRKVNRGDTLYDMHVKVRSRRKDPMGYHYLYNYIVMYILNVSHGEFGPRLASLGIVKGLNPVGIQIMNPFEEIPEVKMQTNLGPIRKKPNSTSVTIQPIVHAVIMASYFAIYLH